MSQDLAKRAVACAQWRWMPGMLTTENARVLLYDDSTGNLCAHMPCGLGDELLPDFSDPATIGCLLALVREAWDVGYGENKYAYIAVNPPVTPHMGEPWSVVVCDHNGEWPFGFDGDTEAEALIEALEAAP